LHNVIGPKGESKRVLSAIEYTVVYRTISQLPLVSCEDYICHQLYKQDTQ